MSQVAWSKAAPVSKSSERTHSWEWRARFCDRMLFLASWAAAACITLVFGWLIIDILWHALPKVSFAFLFSHPTDAGRGGGIGPVIMSTLMILLVCLVTAVPLGVASAALLAEFSFRHQRFATLVRRSLDVLAGVPSIVFGLFGNAFFSKGLGLGFSILSGGLTLACMVLPLLIRTMEEGFRMIPDHVRLGAHALGISRTSSLFHLLIPLAMPGLIVGLILGIGRALAETAALIFTSGYVTRIPDNILDSGRALSVHIYDLAMNVPGGEGNAYASALVLVCLLIVINLGAIFLSQRWQKSFVKGQL